MNLESIKLSIFKSQQFLRRDIENLAEPLYGAVFEINDPAGLVFIDCSLLDTQKVAQLLLRKAFFYS